MSREIATKGYFNADHLTRQEAVKASAKLSKKDEVTFAVREGKSGTFSYIAENLTPQEAEEKVKLLADLSKIGVKNGEIVSFVAKNLEAEDVAKFIKNLAQGNIDLNKLSEHGWKEAKGEATGFKDSVAELADDVTISVAAGIVAGTLFTVFGPVGFVVVAGGMAVMEKAVKGDYSVSSSVLGGELFTLSGSVGAMLIPLGVGAAVKLLPDKMLMREG